ncbi:hypothetical protein C8R44DRAFT_732877 [Mycena epipterygia]|nr:hypothetical protein C8R44DRAFT_732877 [Mycena epipterygia]
MSTRLGKNNIFGQRGPCTGSEIHGNYENVTRTHGTSVLRESKETHVVVFVSKVVDLDRTDSMISEQCCSSPCEVEVANGCFGLGQGLVDLCEGETSHRPEIHATVAWLGMKSCDFGSIWPRILYPWKFEEADRYFALAQGLVDLFIILGQFGHGYYIRGTLKRLMGVLACLKAWWICTRNPCDACLAGEEMPAKVVILAQFGHEYYIRGTLKRVTDVLACLEAWWIRVSVKQVTDQKSMPLLHRWRGNACKVVILAQFDHGYYIRGTLKRLMGVLACLKVWWIRAWWIRVSMKQVTDQKSMPPLHRWRGNACKGRDFGSVWPWILYPWDCEEADGCFGLPQGLVDLFVILAQFGHGYYIRGTLKRLTDVLAWLKAWSRTRNSFHCCLAREEMPAKVVILAQFGHGYYIRGTLKRLTDVLAWLKAWWIFFDHGYYIRGTLKRLMGVLACLKAWWIRAWWICVSVKKVTDQKSMPPLHHWRGNTCKSHDFGSVWPRILYPWDFAEADGCFGLAQGLVDPFWPRILYPWDFAEADGCFGLPPGFVDPFMILAQFGHGYYIHGTLQRLMGVLACLKAWWIRRLTDVVAWLKAWWICKSMPLLPRWGGKVVILAQFGHRYYIRGTLK